MRKNYEMTLARLEQMIAAMQPSPVIAMHCGMPPSVQEKANAEWKKLGDEMGFDFMTVEPIAGKGGLHFTAIPKEIEEAVVVEEESQVPEMTEEVVPMQRPPSEMICEKTGAVAYIAAYNVYAICDVFVKDSVRVFRIAGTNFLQPRGDLVHYTVWAIDQWFDRLSTGTSTLISTSAAYHGYEGVTMDGR